MCHFMFSFILAFVIAPLFIRAADRPNVVLILADDLGYADVGYHGSPDMKTPHIDSIASNGVRFSAGYVTAPVCGPSRAGLLTGIYQNRFGAEDNPGPYKVSKDVKVGIPKTIKTLPERLKALGYVTGMIGKGHTGYEPEFHPNASGFDEFFGFINGASNYRPDGRWGKKINQPDNPILRNHTKVEETEYLTDAFGREAVSFIDRHADQPFFLYVPFNAVHGPLQALDKDLAAFSSIKDEKRRLVVAMNYTLDCNVGRILTALQKHNLAQNTLVLFLSDNGGDPVSNASLNTPLRGHKGQLWDGGIRIPFFLQWPAQIKAGQKIDSPVISMDILPTVISAVGGSAKEKVDGIDLIPLLTGKATTLPERFIYWRFNRAWTIRDAEWKLIIPGGTEKRPLLFHIASDISETKDLYSEKPAIAQRLQNAYTSWSSEMMPKLWGWDKSFPVYDPKIGGE